VVFETAARCGGGFDADISKLISGVDFYTRLLGIALGDRSMELSSASTTRHGAAMVRFLAPPVGEVREVRGLDAARKLAGVLDADVYARAGDRLGGLVNAASRVGHLLVTASSRDELVRRADDAERTIEIVVAN
jgi:biotin carboxylase